MTYEVKLTLKDGSTPSPEVQAWLDYVAQMLAHRLEERAQSILMYGKFDQYGEEQGPL